MTCVSQKEYESEDSLDNLEAIQKLWETSRNSLRKDNERNADFSPENFERDFQNYYTRNRYEKLKELFKDSIITKIMNEKEKSEAVEQSKIELEKFRYTPHELNTLKKTQTDSFLFPRYHSLIPLCLFLFIFFFPFFLQ